MQNAKCKRQSNIVSGIFLLLVKTVFFVARSSYVFLMLVSLYLYQLSGDVESSNSWDSSLAACPHQPSLACPHQPSFLNKFLQSESFVDCKHLHPFPGLLGVNFRKPSEKGFTRRFHIFRVLATRVLLVGVLQLSFPICSPSTHIVVNSTIQTRSYTVYQSRLWDIYLSTQQSYSAESKTDEWQNRFADLSVMCWAIWLFVCKIKHWPRPKFIDKPFALCINTHHRH